MCLQPLSLLTIYKTATKISAAFYIKHSPQTPKSTCDCTSTIQSIIRDHTPQSLQHFYNSKFPMTWNRLPNYLQSNLQPTTNSNQLAPSKIANRQFTCLTTIGSSPGQSNVPLGHHQYLALS